MNINKIKKIKHKINKIKLNDFKLRLIKSELRNYRRATAGTKIYSQEEWEKLMNESIDFMEKWKVD